MLGHSIAWSSKVSNWNASFQFYYTIVLNKCVCVRACFRECICIVVVWGAAGNQGWCRLPGSLIFIGFHQRHLASPASSSQAGRCLISGYSHTLVSAHPQPAPGFYHTWTNLALFLYFLSFFHAGGTTKVSACPDLGNFVRFVRITFGKLCHLGRNTLVFHLYYKIRIRISIYFRSMSSIV